MIYFRGVSHSVLNDMQTIEQENLQTTQSSLSSLGKLRLSDTDSFFDDFSISSSFNINRNSNSGFGSSKGADPFFSENSNSRADSWVIVDDPPAEKSRSTPRPGEFL